MRRRTMRRQSSDRVIVSSIPERDHQVCIRLHSRSRRWEWEAVSNIMIPLSRGTWDLESCRRAEVAKGQSWGTMAREVGREWERGPSWVVDYAVVEL